MKRLFGDSSGSVLMEYVVLGLMFVGFTIWLWSGGEYEGQKGLGGLYSAEGHWVGIGAQIKRMYQTLIGGLALPLP